MNINIYSLLEDIMTDKEIDHSCGIYYSYNYTATTTCDEPPDVDFSMKFKLCSGDQTPGCRVIYGCQKGYKLVYGSITKTCGIDGHWSDDIHICARKLNAYIIYIHIYILYACMHNIRPHAYQKLK